MEDKNQNLVSQIRHNNRHLLGQEASKAAEESDFHGKLKGNLKSGVSLGSGEYFMDVLVGTQPKQFSFIGYIGSGLNWLQCLPCYDFFEQARKFYDPKEVNRTNTYSNPKQQHRQFTPQPRA